jgi:pimeloyl-ACP methyl ester carboxylesterase
VKLPPTLEGVRDEAVAVAKAAGSYLIGLPDPHDEDVIELVRCRDDVPVCFLTPVFLVHGFLHNWSGWLPLMAVLRDAGFARFVRFNYDSVGDSPEETAGAFSRRVHEVAERTGATRLHFVGHSLGGVVVRIHAVMHGGGPRLEGSDPGRAAARHPVGPPSEPHRPSRAAPRFRAGHDAR